MLDEKEIRKVKSYCVLPKLTLAAIVASAITGLWWAFLVRIDRVLLGSSGLYIPAFILCFTKVAIYVVFFVYFFISTRIGLSSKKWRAIEDKVNRNYEGDVDNIGVSRTLSEKALAEELERSNDRRLKNEGKVLEGKTAISTFGWAHKYSNLMEENAREVAEKAGIKVPDVKKYIALLVIVPMLLLLISFIPEFLNANSIKG